MKEVTIRITENRLSKLKDLCSVDINDQALIYVALDVFEQIRNSDRMSELMKENENLVKKINGQHCQIQRLHKKITRLLNENEKVNLLSQKGAEQLTRGAA